MIISCPASPSVDGKIKRVTGCASTASPTDAGTEINMAIQVALLIFPVAPLMSPVT